MVLLPAGAGGTIIGGLLVEKLRLNVRQIFRIQIAMSCLITTSCVLFLLVCDTTKFAGVTVPYNASRSACHTSLVYIETVARRCFGMSRFRLGLEKI